MLVNGGLVGDVVMALSVSRFVEVEGISKRHCVLCSRGGGGAVGELDVLQNIVRDNIYIFLSH